MRLRLLVLGAFVLGMVVGWVLDVNAASYYVSVSGNDSNACTSVGSPCKTIARAAGKVAAGDVVYIRGGVYHESVTVNASGTQAQPITFTNYNGEEPILDGTDSNGLRYSIPTRQNGGALFYVKGNYIVVRNLTTRYSGDRGFNLEGQHGLVEDCLIYESWGSGIYMNNYYNTAQGNTVRSCSMKYYYYLYPDAQYPGYWNWSTGITCARYPMYGAIRNNVSYDNWGHGISTYESEYTVVEGNVSYNNNHLNFYVSDAKYITMRNNLSYCTPGNDRKNGFQYGIYTGDEIGHPDPFPGGSGRVPSSDNTFVNNLSMGCDKPLSIKTGVSNGNLFAFNTVVNGTETPALEFRSGSCTNCRFVDNVVVQEDGLAVAIYDGSGMSFSNNLWSKTAPSSVRTPSDVVGNPLLAKLGSFSAGSLTGEWFKLTSGSPAIDKGIPVSGVSYDFFGKARGSSPDIGGHEYGGGGPVDGESPGPPGGVRIVNF